jgi:hypothetical protein
LKGICNVQGLLAFSSLAKDSKENSTIIYDRVHDLGRDQRNYSKYFGNYHDMLEFSQINRVIEFISEKAENFEKDIVESNKNKIVNRLNTSIKELSKLKCNHSEISARLDEEVKRYLKRIEILHQDFKNNYKNKLNIIIDEILLEFQNRIIDEFDNKPFDINIIESNIKKLYEEIKKDISNRIYDESKRLLSELEMEINKSLEWLQSDMKSFVKYRNINHIVIDTSVFTTAIDEMKLKIKDYLFYAFDIGQFVFDAVTLAAKSGDPLIVIAAGLAAFFTKTGIVIKDITIGRKREIRNMVRRELESEIDVIKQNYETEIERITKETNQVIDNLINENIIDVLKQEIINLEYVEDILSGQIYEIKAIKNKIEEKTYGTI